MSTWLITGTSSGFGRLLAETVLERGGSVVGTSRTLDRLRDLQDRFGERFLPCELDVTDPDAVRRVVDSAFSDSRRIDVLVNNAGVGVFASVEETTEQQLTEVVETNLLGSIRVIRAALPHLRAQRGGRILQIASSGGSTTYPNFSSYHASKWGIEGYCETLAAEVAPFGIAVTIVEPGATPTGFGESMLRAPAMPEYDQTPAGEMRRQLAEPGNELPNDPAKIVDAITDLVDSDRTPLRLPLGPDAYADIRASLLARLELHEASREIALSVGRDDASTHTFGL